MFTEQRNGAGTSHEAIQQRAARHLTFYSQASISCIQRSGSGSGKVEVKKNRKRRRKKMRKRTGNDNEEDVKAAEEVEGKRMRKQQKVGKKKKSKRSRKSGWHGVRKQESGGGAAKVDAEKKTEGEVEAICGWRSNKWKLKRRKWKRSKCTIGR